MNIVKTIRQILCLIKDPRINAEYPDSKETKIPNVCANPEKLSEQGEFCKVTVQGKDVTSSEKLRIKAKVKNCKEINGIIAYI